jgi:hypothetical protein
MPTERRSCAPRRRAASGIDIGTRQQQVDSAAQVDHSLNGSVKYGDRTFVEGHLESLIAEVDDNNSETAEKVDRGAPSPLR